MYLCKTFFKWQPQFIANYTNENNKGAYQLADDIDDCLILVLNFQLELD
jgi:hypothetical protein